MNRKWSNSYSEVGKLLLTHTDGRQITLLVDEEDKHLLLQYQWCWSINYALSSTGEYLHRVLLPHLPEVKHINGSTLDNRRCNLRDSSKSHTSLNRSRLGTYVGVSLVQIRRWRYWSANWSEGGKWRHKLFPYTEQGLALATEYRRERALEYYQAANPT